jgi:hypothetical protein
MSLPPRVRYDGYEGLSVIPFVRTSIEAYIQTYDAFVKDSCLSFPLWKTRKRPGFPRLTVVLRRRPGKSGFIGLI